MTLTDSSYYDYFLPKERIAQYPLADRTSAKLMHVAKNNGKITHGTIADFPNLLKQGDVIVINNTKVFKARLLGELTTPNGYQRYVELFLVRPENNGWIALAKPLKQCVLGSKITIHDDFFATVTKQNTDGTIVVCFNLSHQDVMQKANIFGHVPVPPYITTEPALSDYQTEFAKITGSVAAPTAGLHLTKDLLHKIKNKGIHIVEITLHVGLGTFLPMKTQSISDHIMHPEWVSISQEACDEIYQAKKNNGRIIAIGTTTVRTLEGVAQKHQGKLVSYNGDISIFITPGFQFQIIDGLFTNFHLPKSTLLVLVSAFGGYIHMKNAYSEAIKSDYRFYSFGDAMCIL